VKHAKLDTRRLLTRRSASNAPATVILAVFPELHPPAQAASLMMPSPTPKHMLVMAMVLAKLALPSAHLAHTTVTLHPPSAQDHANLAMLSMVTQIAKPVHQTVIPATMTLMTVLLFATVADVRLAMEGKLISSAMNAPTIVISVPSVVLMEKILSSAATARTVMERTRMCVPNALPTAQHALIRMEV